MRNMSYSVEFNHNFYCLGMRHHLPLQLLQRQLLQQEGLFQLRRQLQVGQPPTNISSATLLESFPSLEFLIVSFL